jgi:hypothetical protein
VKKDTLVQASPAQTKKQEEDADRVMKKNLEEEDKDAATVRHCLSKEKAGKKTGKERYPLIHLAPETLPTGAKRRNMPRSRRIRRGQRQRLFLRRRLKVLQQYL